jgi:hypothetical protein
MGFALHAGCFSFSRPTGICPQPGDKGIIRIRREGSLSMLGKGKSLLLEELPLPKKGLSNSPAALRKRTFLLRLDSSFSPLLKLILK